MNDIMSAATREAIKEVIIESYDRWALPLDSLLDAIGFSTATGFAAPRPEITHIDFERFWNTRDWSERSSLLPLDGMFEQALARGDIAIKQGNRLQDLLKIDGYRIKNLRVFRI